MEDNKHNLHFEVIKGPLAGSIFRAKRTYINVHWSTIVLIIRVGWDQGWLGVSKILGLLEMVVCKGYLLSGIL